MELEKQIFGKQIFGKQMFAALCGHNRIQRGIIRDFAGFCPVGALSSLCYQ